MAWPLTYFFLHNFPGIEDIFSLPLETETNFYKEFILELLKKFVGAINQCSSSIILGKNYISLDWHPKAKELFYNEKSAEDFAQDDSFHVKAMAKKQTVRLDECLELYTSKEKLGENDAW